MSLVLDLSCKTARSLVRLVPIEGSAMKRKKGEKGGEKKRFIFQITFNFPLPGFLAPCPQEFLRGAAPAVGANSGHSARRSEAIQVLC